MSRTQKSMEKETGNEGDSLSVTKDADLEQYWEDVWYAYDRVHGLLKERHAEILDALREIDTTDPYMIGFVSGLKTGCRISRDLVMVALEKASTKEHYLPNASKL